MTVIGSVYKGVLSNNQVVAVIGLLIDFNFRDYNQNNFNIQDYFQKKYVRTKKLFKPKFNYLISLLIIYNYKCVAN